MDWPCAPISVSNTDILQNAWGNSPKYLAAFLGIFDNTPLNTWGHSGRRHSRTAWQHSPDSLPTLPRGLRNIARNVYQHSPEYLRIFPGMFGDIPRYITFPHSRVPRLPFFVPVFLVSYTAQVKVHFFWLKKWNSIKIFPGTIKKCKPSHRSNNLSF